MPLSNNAIRLGTHAPLIDVRVQPAGLNGAIDQIIAKARVDGVKSGLNEVAGVLDRAVKNLEEHTSEAEESIGRAAIELGLEIARHLLKTEIEAERHDIERIVRDTLHEARVGRDACVVHLNPADYRRLDGVAFRNGTKLQADDGVAPGDVQVESALGCIVREIDTAVESIGERLRGEMSQ